MEILLNGCTIDELKATKAAVQKDAAAYIATATEQLKQLVQDIVDSEEGVASEGVEAMADKALELADNIQLVHSVTGVLFDIGYRSEYDSSGDVLSEKLDNLFEESGLSYDQRRNLAVWTLSGTLEDMEGEVADWNSSSC